MAKMNFPANPSLNDIVQLGEQQWKWDGTKWRKLIQSGVVVNAINGQTGEVTLHKSDIGLDNVENFPVATEVEAQTGTHNGRYMTPLRTKEAILELSPPTDLTAVDAHIADTTKHFTQAQISITESQISDLGTYITDYTVTESDVTAHEAALSITESQISDFGSYEPANANIQTHISDTSNPHSVTAAQVGAEPAFVKNTGFNKDFGSTAETVTEGNDSRLSNARTPLSHTHGNITNEGAIGTASDQVVVTTTSGVLTTASRSGIDSRSTFPPNSHTHTFASLTSKPTTLSGYGITDAYTQSQINSAINTAVSGLVDTAPGTLDTLNELAAALGDDPNFATTVSNSIGNKADKATTITAGAGLTGGGDLTANRTVSHADTSSQASVNNSGRTYIQDITLDTYGHITGIVSATETVVDTNTVTRLRGTTGGTFVSGDITLAASGATSISQSGNTITISSTDTNTVYSHPTYAGDDINIDTGALTGATVISDLDFNITTNTLGHVTDANATIATRNLTAANIGAAPASHTHDDRYYTESESNGRYIQEGGQSFSGTYPVAVRVGVRNFYSDPDITFTGSTSTLAVSGNITVGGTSVSLSGHTHDGRYYTETEVNSLLAGKLGTSAKAADSNLLDGIDSSQFVRSDTADTIAGNHEFYSTDTGGSYSTAAIELREANLVSSSQSAIGYAPSISWHWSGRKQVSMRLLSNGKLTLDGSHAGQILTTSEGNAVSANKWTTSRTLSLTGDASGSTSWDGSGNASISVVVNNDSHTHDDRYYTESEADIRFGRFTNDITLNSSTTTASFITELTNEQGCFQNNYRAMKVGWSYAGNSDLNTGHPTIGTIELAGCLIEAWGGLYKHVRITRPTTGTGGSKIVVYNDQSSSYSPGWREIWTSESDGSGSGLDADLLDGNHASAFYLASNPSGYTTYSANQAVNTNSSPTFSNMYLASVLYHAGDTNTYMQFHASDQWRVVTGGTERLEVNNTNTTVQNNLIVNGSTAEVQGNAIYHEGNLTAATIGAAASSHTHGNLSSTGTWASSPSTIGSGDYLVIGDSSNSSKLAQATLRFGTDTTDLLTNAGTWRDFGDLLKSMVNVSISSSSTTGGSYSVAIGYSADARASYSTAVGGHAEAGVNTSHTYSSAFGYDATALGKYDTALGEDASIGSTYDSSTAVGANASVTASNMFRLGGTNITNLACSDTTISTTSDVRDKADFGEVDKALDLILNLEPITYVRNSRGRYEKRRDEMDEHETMLWKEYGYRVYDKEEHAKETKKGSRRQIGFKAQEVAEVMEALYGSDNYAGIVNIDYYDQDVPEEIEKRYSVEYARLVPFLVKAMQEQQKQIDELKEMLGID